MAGQSHGEEVDDGLDVGHIHSGKDHKHEAAENREVLFDLQPIYDEKSYKNMCLSGASLNGRLPLHSFRQRGLQAELR